MEISTNTAIFAMMFLALISLVIVAYRRKEYLYIDPAGLSRGFVDGFVGCCDDLGVVVGKIDIEKIDANDAIVVVSHRLPTAPLKPGSAFVAAGYEDAPEIAHHNISTNATALLRRALGHVRAIHSKSVLVIQDETGPNPMISVEGNHIHVRTTPDKVAGEIMKITGGKPAHTAIICDASMANPEITKQFTMVVGCGFCDETFDACFFHEDYEQGYIAGVIAYNTMLDRPLFRDRNIYTKIYAYVKG